ncbi:hypothetical protein WAF17_19635 [Bernardetia sp. ABR2-2B]|uniref:DUF7832 domain-containing protein n=1 Tax=Bernardetia sp. ABR2-2B TaxID=3127472 RepID=UPI0030CB8FCB
MLYDKANDHLEKKEFMDLSIIHAHTHIGIFLTWIAKNDLTSEDFEDEAGLQIRNLEQRSISCCIFSELWDGVISDEMLNEKAQKFADAYYATGKYIEDYRKIFPEHDCMYLVEDTWENYEKVAKVLDMRFLEWKNINA